jgi:hypothetical protein
MVIPETCWELIAMCVGFARVIDGVRAHQDAENHTGSFASVSAAITVSR